MKAALPENVDDLTDKQAMGLYVIGLTLQQWRRVYALPLDINMTRISRIKRTSLVIIYGMGDFGGMLHTCDTIYVQYTLKKLVYDRSAEKAAK